MNKMKFELKGPWSKSSLEMKLDFKQASYVTKGLLTRLAKPEKNALITMKFNTNQRANK